LLRVTFLTPTIGQPLKHPEKTRESQKKKTRAYATGRLRAKANGQQPTHPLLPRHPVPSAKCNKAREVAPQCWLGACRREARLATAHTLAV
jgi:hypothetical protein